ncbi:DUF6090 family protein [Aestuariivivens sediminis]|uniref:DUF6090 family protein n=1 Tax=Aestuariivivens sediminis TaxID=2913557 RepID=UPI001F57112C|nr:DUF6090 family protein [Aestuariivivens sediminis]
MIKFFRQIRQRLLSEGKNGKYLKYAFGEIILVVIGILIALQINNWNNNNQQKKIEIKYLKEIKQNLTKDLDDIDFNIAFNKSKLQSNKIVLEYLNGKINYTDSLDFHFSNLFFSTRTLANMSAYENLKSRGLEIITNDSLRQRITKLYEFDFYNAIDFEMKDDHQFQYQILIPEVTKSLNISEFNVDNAQGSINGFAKPINNESLMNNYSFRNAIRLNHTLRELMTLIYQNLKVSVEDCINQIDHELKNK